MTKEMQVVEFQVQIKDGSRPQEHLWAIDWRAPIPQALEDGNMEGPLYLCVLDSEKLEQFIKYCTTNKNIKIYDSWDSYCSFELKREYYKPNYFVQWQIGDNPLVVSSKNY